MDFAPLLPARSVEDILAERIRVPIGGVVYDLPVLTIRDNRAWKERMDFELGYLVARISLEDDTDAILRLIDGSEQTWLDLLVGYDSSGVLPPRDDIEAGMTPLGLVRAVMEVWRAARPLADISRTGLALGKQNQTTTQTVGWRRRMSSWRRPTAGRRAGSSGN